MMDYLGKACAEFNPGTPPSVGWWFCCGSWYRWWDGEQYSLGIRFNASRKTMLKALNRKVHRELTLNQGWMHWESSPHFHIADKSKLPEKV